MAVEIAVNRMLVSVEEMERAAERLQGVVSHTPLQLSKRLSKRYDATVYLKREDLQEIRSFKIRGAYNKMAGMTAEEKLRGVVCASAGNHAQGVAYSCAALQVFGTIFMPKATPAQKVKRVQLFGGEYTSIVLEGENFDEAGKVAQAYCVEQGAVYVHPFDDMDTIAGQGTVGLEIYNDLAAPDVIVASVGGGGLISGIASCMKQKSPSTKLIGVEPEGAASMQSALQQNRVVSLEKLDTFVDGAAVKTAGVNTFEICRATLEKVIVVPEGRVCMAMVDLYQNEGIIAEPAGALSVSALDDLADDIKGKVVVCVISGGNNDILRYPEIMERSLVYQGLKHYFIIEFMQKPGQLRAFVERALGPTDDIVRFEYMKKTNKEKGAALVGVELQHKNDFEPLLQRMKEADIQFHVLDSREMLYSYII